MLSNFWMHIVNIYDISKIHVKRAFIIQFSINTASSNCKSFVDIFLPFQRLPITKFKQIISIQPNSFKYEKGKGQAIKTIFPRNDILQHISYSMSYFLYFWTRSSKNQLIAKVPFLMSSRIYIASNLCLSHQNNTYYLSWCCNLFTVMIIHK